MRRKTVKKTILAVLNVTMAMPRLKQLLVIEIIEVVKMKSEIAHIKTNIKPNLPIITEKLLLQKNKQGEWHFKKSNQTFYNSCQLCLQETVFLILFLLNFVTEIKRKIFNV